MRKRTVRLEVLEDLHISAVFKESECGEKEVKLVLPDVVKKRWVFKSGREEAAFAGFVSAVSNEYLHFGLSPEETADRLKILVKRTVDAGLLKRREKAGIY